MDLESGRPLAELCPCGEAAAPALPDPRWGLPLTQFPSQAEPGLGPDSPRLGIPHDPLGQAAPRVPGEDEEVHPQAEALGMDPEEDRGCEARPGGPSADVGWWVRIRPQSGRWPPSLGRPLQDSSAPAPSPTSRFCVSCCFSTCWPCCWWSAWCCCPPGWTGLPRGPRPLTPPHPAGPTTPAPKAWSPSSPSSSTYSPER